MKLSNINVLIISLYVLFITSNCENINKNLITVSNNISPKNNAKLNYTQVMFEYPEIKKGVSYKIQIAEVAKSEDFEKLIVIEQKDSTTATLINGLKFGKKYQWRYIAYNSRNEIIFNSNIFFFETLYNKCIDKKYFRYKINYKEVNDGLIFLDGSLCAINRDGEPVWFLPYEIETNKNQPDIKITKGGTITFISKNNSYFGNTSKGVEVSLSGDVLWTTPKPNNTISGDSIENYHHELKKLDNGNYMILGFKNTNQKNINNEKFLVGTILEYDIKGNLVWNWDYEKYISVKDYYIPPKKLNSNIKYDIAHLNGFVYDEKKDILYLSLRNISRILKIDKKTGNILENYGDKSLSGEVKNANNFFKFQHSILLLPNENIAVFNNNCFDDLNKCNKPSSIVVFSQPTKINKLSKIVWQFNCDFDSLDNGYSIRRGNIYYLNNTNFLVNLGQPKGRIFEVTQDKKVVWDCFAEKFDINDKKWNHLCNYRVSYSTSLYPNYFTVTNSFNSDTINYNNDIKLTFNINNEGSNSDTYQIKYIVNNKEVESFVTEEINSGKSRAINVNIKNTDINNKELSIVITSNTNKNYKRNLTFYLNKLVESHKL